MHPPLTVKLKRRLVALRGAITSQTHATMTSKVTSPFAHLADKATKPVPLEAACTDSHFTVRELVQTLHAFIRRDRAVASAPVFLAECKWVKGVPLQVVEVSNNSCILSEDPHEDTEQLTVGDLLAQLSEQMKDDSSFSSATITHVVDTFCLTPTTCAEFARGKLFLF